MDCLGCLKGLQKLWAMCGSVVLQTVVRLCMDIVDQNLDVSVAWYLFLLPILLQLPIVSVSVVCTYIMYK